MHKAGMVQRVTNEVEIQCRLKHPSILEVTLAGHKYYCGLLIYFIKYAVALICSLLNYLCHIRVLHFPL